MFSAQFYHVLWSLLSLQSWLVFHPVSEFGFWYGFISDFLIRALSAEGIQGLAGTLFAYVEIFFSESKFSYNCCCSSPGAVFVCGFGLVEWWAFLVEYSVGLYYYCFRFFSTVMYPVSVSRIFVGVCLGGNRNVFRTMFIIVCICWVSDFKCSHPSAL